MAAVHQVLDHGGCFLEPDTDELAGVCVGEQPRHPVFELAEQSLVALVHRVQ